MRIPARFNGPPGSANGGYTCELVAGLLGVPSAEVTLRSPPPLETEMAAERSGDAVRISDGETLVAEGRRAEPRLDEPHVLVSWPLERAGRKREAACALFDRGGEVLARSRALWIELRQE